MVGELVRANAAPWTVKVVPSLSTLTEPDCTQDASLLGVGEVNYYWTNTSIQVTASVDCMFDGFDVCLSFNGSQWFWLQRKIFNGFVTACETEKAPEVYCWCMTNEKTGKVTSDCRPYYFEPWVDWTSPDTLGDWGPIRDTVQLFNPVF